MVTITYNEMLNLKTGLTKVFGQGMKDIPINVRRDLLLFMKKYNEECKIFNELKSQILKNIPIDEKTKQPIVTPKDAINHKKEYENLLAQKIELKVKKIKTVLVTNIPLSTVDLYNLECVLED